MKVTLFDYTGKGSIDPSKAAASVLLFTKSTRLEMTPTLLNEIECKPYTEIINELKLMANTNPGSWEFVHFTFLIQNVTRAFTHQLVRTRQASYAQQTMRVLEMDKWTYETGPTIKGNSDREVIYNYAMRTIDTCYKELLKNGVKIEDARGVLPTNVHTNICMSINMRNFIALSRKRVSARVQDEYHRVMDAALIEIEKIYPWFYLFYKNDEMKAYTDLQNMIMESNLTPLEKTEMYKKLDIIRSGLD
jgi:flavin-dependent thymidylate synthase